MPRLVNFGLCVRTYRALGRRWTVHVVKSEHHLIAKVFTVMIEADWGKFFNEPPIYR